MIFGRASHYIVTSQKVLNAAEHVHLLRLCRRALREGELRDPLMILLILDCGMRAEELLSLRVRDFDDEHCSIFIRSVKGSNARELPLRIARSRQLRAWLLLNYGVQALHQLDPEAPIFPIKYHALRNVWTLYRPAPKKLHSLRHTFAVNFYTRSKDIRAVQIALGHRNITNTMVYADFYYSRTGLRKLMHG